MGKKKYPPTKLNVFNTEKKLQFDVDTPRFLKEVAETSGSTMYAICWNIFRKMLAMVAERATEINDPILNTIMLRMNLYEVPIKDRLKFIERMRKEFEDDN